MLQPKFKPRDPRMQVRFFTIELSCWAPSYCYRNSISRNFSVLYWNRLCSCYVKKLSLFHWSFLFLAPLFSYITFYLDPPIFIRNTCCALFASHRSFPRLAHMKSKLPKKTFLISPRGRERERKKREFILLYTISWWQWCPKWYVFMVRCTFRSK